MSEPTPLMKQYTSIKEQYSDAILLFRLGDFYEMFGEDAKKASSVLQITLTTRDKGKENPMPMCGIPYFASEGYIDKLVKAGHKVAVCEQVEDPGLTKGIVRREVVRVITPGTHTPEKPKQNNYIMSFMPSAGVHGIALADVSTGEFTVYESSKPLEDEILRAEPSEVIMPESLRENIHYAEVLKNLYVSPVEDWKFDYSEAYKSLLRHLKVSSLEGFGIEGMSASIASAGALVEYLEGTQGDIRFRKIIPANQGDVMFLDAPTQRNLELVRNLKDGGSEGTLLWALDETLTPMGGRFMRNAAVKPLISEGRINRRLRAVSHLVENYELMEALRSGLRKMLDMERLAQKVSTGNANARDLTAVRNSLELIPAIKNALAGSSDELLSAAGEAMSEFSGTRDIITRGIVDQPPHTLREGGLIRKGFDAEVDELRAMSGNAKDYIASLEAQERQATGISSLKVGYNKVFGYYIEVTKSNLEHVPEHYIRKQTLVGAERFITPELKDYETKVLGAEERLKVLEYEVFLRILESVRKDAPALMDTAESIARVDFLLSLAVVAKRHNYAMPIVTAGTSLKISGGRHPVLERLPLGERFIPNDTYMDGDAERLLIITGPNMAGKSTYMRQVALIVLMAQMGGFVPAEEAEIGLVDRVFTRIGASDFLTKGQSTFMVEMIETANILNNATERSLIVLDEVGRGTSTFDGISIAWATAEFISRNIRARTLFATHYNELTELAGSLKGVRNYNVAVKEWGEEIIFLRRIEEGPADKSYGIQVARLAGLPEEVISDAKDILTGLEKQHVGESSPEGLNQLDLFAVRSDAIIKDLQSLDLEGLSQQEALARIRELQKKSRMIS
jgi:DNA mismatch repair protein MutS